MKTDSFSGYMIYRDIECVFNFNNYVLEIIPGSQETMYEIKCKNVFKSLTEQKSNGFINNLVIKGTSFEPFDVIFCVIDNPSYNNGAFRYQVLWLYKRNAQYDETRINYIEYESAEINHLYNASAYIKDDIVKGENCYDYNLNFSFNNETNYGTFKYNSIEYNIKAKADYRKNYSKNEDLNIFSKLILSSSNDIKDIEDIYKVSMLQLGVINFLTYRRNCGYKDITTYYKNGSMNDLHPTGSLFINTNITEETDIKYLRRVISINNIDKLNELYALISENKIYLSHICNSSADMREYTVQRMLAILISFERLFRWKYKESDIRSEEYFNFLDNLKRVVSLNKDEICKDTKKKYFDSYLNGLQKIRIDFSSMVAYVINQNQLSFKYIENIYGCNKADKKLVTTISDRLNKLRNGMAHGTLDIDFTSENTNDVQLLEVLVYIVILGHIGLSDEEIIQKINILFDYKYLIV